MNQNDSVRIASDASNPRRTFLRSSLLLAVPVALGGAAFSAVAAYSPRVRRHGSARISVRETGATGNGTHDDTLAFQRAINALPRTGGTVTVPAGTYMIDAVRSVQLRSRMHLEMSPNAKLVAKPNSARKYKVLSGDKVDDVEISGGQIIGERDQHRGSVGEWGHGICFRGADRVTIRDIRISKCWGDGISIAALPVWRAPHVPCRDITVSNVVSTGNRRAGMSICNVLTMKVHDSEFSDTHGASPQCGINVEPDGGPDNKGHCNNVHVENCLLRGNAAYGFNVWKRARDVTVTRCTIERNKSCGLVTRGLVGANITRNTVRYNAKTGIYIQYGTKDCAIRENTFQNNYTIQGIKPRADFTQVGVTRRLQKDLIRGRDTYNIRIGRNRYK